MIAPATSSGKKSGLTARSQSRRCPPGTRCAPSRPLRALRNSLHAGAVHRLGRVGDGVVIHPRRHGLAGHILGCKERRQRGHVRQRVEQASRLDVVFADSRATLARDKVKNIRRAADVVSIAAAIAKTTARPGRGLASSPCADIAPYSVSPGRREAARGFPQRALRGPASNSRASACVKMMPVSDKMRSVASCTCLTPCSPNTCRRIMLLFP